jgi:hypothetical protein
MVSSKTGVHVDDVDGVDEGRRSREPLSAVREINIASKKEGTREGRSEQLIT